MFKFICNIFNFKHVHCYCDKKYDITDDKGHRIIIMACNKCGKEQTNVISKIN